MIRGTITEINFCLKVPQLAFLDFIIQMTVHKQL